MCAMLIICNQLVQEHPKHTFISNLILECGSCSNLFVLLLSLELCLALLHKPQVAARAHSQTIHQDEVDRKKRLGLLWNHITLKRSSLIQLQLIDFWREWHLSRHLFEARCFSSEPTIPKATTRSARRHYMWFWWLVNQSNDQTLASLPFLGTLHTVTWFLYFQVIFDPQDPHFRGNCHFIWLRTRVRRHCHSYLWGQHGMICM